MRELVDRRTLVSKTYKLGGGKRMLRLGLKKPLHYINTQGQLEDIDLTPTLDRRQHFISKTSYKARIGWNFPGYRYTGSRGTISAELVSINGNPIAKREPVYKDKRFFWQSISFDTDLSIIPRNARLDAIVTLHSANAPKSFTWEILGQKGMMRPVIGRDASGNVLELEQQWNGDRLTIVWTGKVFNKKRLRKGQVLTEPKYPVWIDPTVNEAIAAGADDGYSFTGIVTSSNFVYTRVVAGINPYVHLFGGLRFQTVAIPQGATITSATLTLDVTNINGSPSARIYGNDVDNAGAWSNPGNLIRNITKTTAFASFAPSSTGTHTVGVTGVVQEIINRGGFSSNNNLAFGIFATASGATLSIAAYEHATRQEAQLDIVYTAASAEAPFLRPFGIFGLS